MIATAAKLFPSDIVPGNVKPYSFATPLLFCLLACSDNQDPEGADALWEQIHEANYQGYARAPGYDTRQPSDAPHSDNVEIFINETVVDALTNGELSSWPEGSLIVKDGYTDDGAHKLVAAMEKRSDGWFWAEWDAEGDAEYSGKPDVCIDCHASGSDFVLAFGFGK